MSLHTRPHCPYCAIVTALAALLAGCGPRPAAIAGAGTARVPAQRAAAQPRPAPAVVAAASVQALPAYAEAKTACRKGEYGKAADILCRMQKSPMLNAEQKEFCYRQEVICLGHISKAAAKARVARGSGTVAVKGGNKLAAASSQSSAGVDCGPRALQLACEKLGVKSTLIQLRQMAGTDKNGTTLAGLKRASEGLGLKTEAVQAGRAAISQMKMPAVAWVNGSHYIAVVSLRGSGDQGTARVHDPNDESEKTISTERLLQLSSGYMLTLRR